MVDSSPLSRVAVKPTVPHWHLRLRTRLVLPPFAQRHKLQTDRMVLHFFRFVLNKRAPVPQRPLGLSLLRRLCVPPLNVSNGTGAAMVTRPTFLVNPR